MTRRIVRLALLVPGHASAPAFCTGPMRFACLEDTDPRGGKRWVLVAPAGGGTEVLMARAVGPQQLAAIGNQGGGRVWLFLETDDFARDHARVTAAGVPFDAARQTG